ncbi:hypothetical protein AB0N37_32865 [Streptomyces griseoincarnatus]
MPGHSTFNGWQLHTVNYRSPADFAGQRVVVVCGGNSGAQIATDPALNGRVEVTWVAQRPPPRPGRGPHGHRRGRLPRRHRGRAARPRRRTPDREADVRASVGNRGPVG